MENEKENINNQTIEQTNEVISSPELPKKNIWVKILKILGIVIVIPIAIFMLLALLGFIFMGDKVKEASRQINIEQEIKKITEDPDGYRKEGFDKLGKLLEPSIKKNNDRILDPTQDLTNINVLEVGKIKAPSSWSVEIFKKDLDTFGGVEYARLVLDDTYLSGKIIISGYRTKEDFDSFLKNKIKNSEDILSDEELDFGEGYKARYIISEFSENNKEIILSADLFVYSERQWSCNQEEEKKYGETSECRINPVFNLRYFTLDKNSSFADSNWDMIKEQVEKVFKSFEPIN